MLDSEILEFPVNPEARPSGTLAIMKHELHILLLEDSDTDADLVRHALRRGGVSFSLDCVDHRAAFIRSLEKSPPDLILSDFSLPSIDGYTALALARAV